MTDVRFCKVQFEEPPLAPERPQPRERPSARDDQIPPRRGRLGPSWRGLGPSGEGRAGRRHGPSRTASDSRRP